MIVAVKALEGKMGKLEDDMKKAKEEVGGAASSIDRIDALLSRLGSDNDDELDPSV
jgi:ribosome assembly protein YihI (activator of Der GTPase)